MNVISRYYEWEQNTDGSWSNDYRLENGKELARDSGVPMKVDDGGMTYSIVQSIALHAALIIGSTLN
jgi:hypothetical protein